MHARSDLHQTLAGRVFGIEEAERRRQFSALRDARKLSGAFDDERWKYKGNHIVFSSLENASSQASRVAMRNFGGALARCFVVESMMQGLTHEAVNGRLYGFKWLSKIVGDELCGWLQLNVTTLKKVVRDLSAETSKATAYNRANSISVLLEYINRIVHKLDGGPVALMPRRLRWKHGLANPIRTQLDITSKRAQEHSDKKYIPSLHVALGAARSTIVAKPSLEPVTGYDLLRLEPLTFATALGLRVGEICSLPWNAVDCDEGTGSLFVRVMTEKSEHPSVRPVSKLWSPLVSEAYDYLLSHCSQPRSRAKEIETNGFEFVRRDLMSIRTSRPLSRSKTAQLEAAGLQADLHYSVLDLVSCFQVSAKEFNSSGKYGETLRPLPKIVAAKLVLWLDARFRRWDWDCFAIARRSSVTGQSSDMTLSVAQVGKLAGASKSTVPKADWFQTDLRDLLIALSENGIFGGNVRTDHLVREEFKAKWTALRHKMLSRSGGGQCTVVDVEAFCAVLERRYRRNLERHFKEEFEDEGSEMNSTFGAKSQVPGAPRNLSEHLIVVWESQFSGNSNLGVLPRPIMRSDFYNYLCTNGQKKTIFQRLQIKDDAGKIFSLTMHNIRHWVTTALLRSGPSEMMVDLWMGRTPGQSRHYDHRTASERAEAVRHKYLQVVVPDDVLGRKVKVWREEGFSESHIGELVKSKLRVMHFVPWGACSRELYTSPCTRGLMCLRGFGSDSACESFHIDPSCQETKSSIVALREKYLAMLRVLDPVSSMVKEEIELELNSSEPVDQHMKFILDVVRGCDQALSAFAVGEDRLKKGDKRLIPIASLGVHG